MPESLEPVYVHRQSRTLSKILAELLLGSNNYTAGVIGVDQLATARREGQAVRSKRSWNGVEPLLELKRQLLLAQLVHLEH